MVVVGSEMMNETKSLFGIALRDTYRGAPTGEFIVVMGDGKEFPLDLSFYFSSEPEPPEIDALSHVSGRILDLGCGCGRILKFLQDKGCDAIGIDIDHIAVDVAHQRGCKQVLVGTLDDLNDHTPFDTILLLNRTLCAMGTLNQIESVLNSCHSLAGVHGKIIFDSIEVKDDLAHPSPGIMQDTIHFRYADATSGSFVRTYFNTAIARDLISKTGWQIADSVAWDDRFWMICQRS